METTYIQFDEPDNENSTSSDCFPQIQGDLKEMALIFSAVSFAYYLRLSAGNLHKNTMKKLLTSLLITFTTTAFAQVDHKLKPSDFIPKGYVLFEKITGDLNNDSLADCVLIIKGTDSSKIVTHEYRGQLDRNRRGIIVLLNKNNHYLPALKNYDCFSSENEDGGVYYPPELSIEISKGKLYVHYSHGRYGYWKYTFRFRNADLELIGYDASYNRGPVVNKETSINFLTKKKKVKVNVNDDAEGDDEVFEETWKNIKIDRLIRLSEIKDFGELDMSGY